MSAKIKDERIPTEPITIRFADGDDAPASEYVKSSEAREMLGVTRPTMARLIRDGVIPTKADMLDRRLKWVSVEDLRKIIKESPAAAAHVGAADEKRNGRAQASRGGAR